MKKILFIAFDVFPSNKGASTHIAQNLEVIRNLFSEVTLITLGTADMPTYQEEGNIKIYRCKANHPNFIKRTEYFADFLLRSISQKKFDVVFFRDIWGGYPVLFSSAAGNAKKIFEVNGVPSIELYHRYPSILKNSMLMERIKSMEQFLFRKSDLIVTVSETNQKYIKSRGIDQKKIAILPNAIAKEPFIEKYEDLPEKYIFYCGTLSSWQGVDLLIEAFKILNKDNLSLLISSSTQKDLKTFRKKIKKMNLDEKVILKSELSRPNINDIYQKALFSVAPLSKCDRNLLQGCSPIKIIESMGMGTPVIASDISVTRELIDHDKNGLLFKPDSVRAFAFFMDQLLNNPKKRDLLAINAQKKANDQFSFACFSKKFNVLLNKL